MHWATAVPGWAASGIWGAPVPAYGQYGAAVPSEQEGEALKNQARALQTALDQINKRLNELGSQ
jgi:hypothetical protein